MSKYTTQTHTNHNTTTQTKPNTNSQNTNRLKKITQAHNIINAINKYKPYDYPTGFQYTVNALANAHTHIM